MSDLTLPETTTALEVYSKPDGLDPYVQKARDLVNKFEPDPSTKKGRDEIKSLAYKVSQLKSKLDGMGKELVSEWKTKAKAVDDSRKSMRDQLDELRDEAKAPLIEWEAVEQKRLDNLNGIITDIQGLINHCPGQSRERLNAYRKDFDDYSEQDFQELQAEADALIEKGRQAVIAELKLLDEREAAELEAAKQREELEKLQAEKADRERIEAEAQRQHEIEMQAMQDKLAAAEAEKAEAERAKIEAEQAAEQARIEAEKAAEREKQRIADEERQAAEAIAAKKAEEEAAAEAEKQRIAEEQAMKEAAEKAEVERIKAEELAAELQAKHQGMIVDSLTDELAEYCKTKAQAKNLAERIADGNFQGLSVDVDAFVSVDTAA